MGICKIILDKIKKIVYNGNNPTFVCEIVWFYENVSLGKLYRPVSLANCVTVGCADSYVRGFFL